MSQGALFWNHSSKRMSSRRGGRVARGAGRVAWLEDGLHVSLDGAPLVGGVEAGGYHVADYRPQPGWRLALSAHGGYPPGRKWVRGLTLLADADVHVGAGSAAEARLELPWVSFAEENERSQSTTLHPLHCNIPPNLRSGVREC